jgi:O-antigen/teichoic acid export membrane protein
LWATPGQLDAGFSSLATFAAGIYAVRELSTVSLGGYALLFSAFHVINQVSAELVFSPSQIIAVDLRGRHRLGMLAHSIPRGGVVALFSSLAVPLGVLTIASQIPRSDLIPLSISAALLAFASPVQDHLRAMLHMAEASWIAALMSAIHFATTILMLLTLSSLVPPWAPFGALFAGNCLSLALGAAWVGRQQVPASNRPTFRELRWLGGWLLASGIGKTSMRYAVTAFLNLVAGVAALGFVEGARVVSQPINVLAQGLMAQVGPRLTAAAAQKDKPAARRWTRRFALLLCGVAVPYALLTAWPWAFNPLATIAPRAYAVPGLTVATSLGVLVASLMRAQRMQLLGARLQKTVARVTIATGLLELALIGTGVIIGAYASPLAAGVVAVVGMIWFARRMRRVYVGHPADSPAMTSS